MAGVEQAESSAVEEKKEEDLVVDKKVLQMIPESGVECFLKLKN